MAVNVKVLCVAGTRPNFVKVAALMRCLSGHPLFLTKLVHTGQHYDADLSGIFFRQLQMPRPDIELEVGSGSHGRQTADILRRFEDVLEDEQPQVVLVVGDVNSTLACALAAAKFSLREPFTWSRGSRLRPIVAHVEAGLRSFDEDMPEEVNRKLTDAISDLLFVSERSGLTNLAREGVSREKVFFVGNVVIDTLLAARAGAAGSAVVDDLGVSGGGYGLLTLHRPSNVDDPGALRGLLSTLDEIASRLPLVFPLHPRTRRRLEEANVSLDPSRWKLMPPVGYLEFIRLQSEARVVLTDSGGIQEETTVLGVPCVTLRENTERPVTVSEGTNVLAGTSRAGILHAFEKALEMPRGGRAPAYWDGKAAERVVAILAAALTPVACGPRLESSWPADPAGPYSERRSDAPAASPSAPRPRPTGTPAPAE
jgi:UDP-N-acetylglucosamine 2-epimerase (non-hydrolysing)